MDTHIAFSHATELLPFIKNVSFGVAGLFVTLWLNVFAVRRLSIGYEIKARICLNKRSPNGVFRHYFLAMIYLMLVQIGLIVIWGFALIALGLMDDPIQAIMFSGSCYTTMGIVADIMPIGWKFMAIIIALSGLFAIAIATSAMLNMSTLFRRAWLYKHADKIQAVLQRENVVIPDFVSIEETIKVKETIKTTNPS